MCCSYVICMTAQPAVAMNKLLHSVRAATLKKKRPATTVLDTKFKIYMKSCDQKFTIVKVKVKR